MSRKESGGVNVFAGFGLFLSVYAVITEVPEVRLTTLCFSLVYVFLCYNLHKLRNWSRISLLVINGIMAGLMSIGDFCIFVWIPWTWMQGGIAGSFGEAFKMVIPLLLQVSRSIPPYNAALLLTLFLIFHIYFYGFLVYFLQRKVKQRFREDRQGWVQGLGMRQGQIRPIT